MITTRFQSLSQIREQLSPGRVGFVVWALAFLLKGITCCRADAMTYDVALGFAACDVRPLPYQTSSGFTATAAIGRIVAPGKSAKASLAAAAGGGGGGIGIPERGDPGRRTLTTVLFGLEVRHAHTSRGSFAFLGLGFGHSTLSDARRDLRPPELEMRIPSRDLTAFAAGASLGHRFDVGSGPFGILVEVQARGL